MNTINLTSLPSWSALAREPYLSQLEYEIIKAIHEGTKPEELSAAWGVQPSQVKNLYDIGMERIRHLFRRSTLKDKTPDPSKNIHQKFLEELGFQPMQYGYRSLEAAVLIAAEHPEWVNSLGKNLFPAVAEQLDIPVSRAASEIRTALAERVIFYRNSATHPDFYDLKGMLNITTNTKRFLTQFLLYLEDGYYVQEDKL